METYFPIADPKTKEHKITGNEAIITFYSSGRLLLDTREIPNGPLDVSSLTWLKQQTN